jgi:hypothetical protein
VWALHLSPLLQRGWTCLACRRSQS